MQQTISTLKPLFGRLLLEQQEITQEEVTNSGIVLLKSSFNLFNFDDEQNKVQNILERKKQNRGTVISVADDCGFVSPGDTVIYRKNTHLAVIEEGTKGYPLIGENDVLVVEKDGKQTPHPDMVLVKVTEESREALFSKKIKRDNGEVISLLVDMPPMDKKDGRANEFYVSAGIVMAAGENIKNVQVGDVALLDYLLDNDDTIIVDYEGHDKIIAVFSKTTRHTDDNIIYRNRKTKRDQIAWLKGDYNLVSGLLGVIHGEELISIEPYVFLNHESTTISRVTESGISYNSKQKILKRQILSVSPESENSIGLSKGENVWVDDFDIFDVTLDGKKISVVNDIDIIGNSDLVPMREFIKD